MQQIRIKNIDDVVPLEYRHRQDFVLNSEMTECCELAAERYGFPLAELCVYYKLRIYKCNLLSLSC